MLPARPAGTSRSATTVRLATATRAVVSLVVAASLAGCSLSSTYVQPGWAPVEQAPLAEIDTTILLIGDAGLPALDEPEPVLVALRNEAAQSPERTTVVFLGDNIYPDGLPDTGHSDRTHAEAALLAQIDAVRDAGAHGVFVPGNHDYYSGGVAALERQANFIRDLGDPRIEYRPAPGCPGPETLDLGQRARLIMVDSQWWIGKSKSAPDACGVTTEAEVVAALRQELGSAGDRHAIIVAHHPMRTHGWHGGNFDWRDHLFPLTRVSSVLWIPLPIIGSLYPLWRTSGRVKQDVSSSTYEHMVGSVESSFEAGMPLMHAAGHDHNLQVLVGEPRGAWIVVSGAGSIERVDPVGRGDDTIAASPFAGFFRLDLLHDGRARLELIEVDEDGRVERPWSAWIQDGTPAIPSEP